MRFRNIILVLTLTAATAAAVLGITHARVPRIPYRITQHVPQTSEGIENVAENGVEQGGLSAASPSSDLPHAVSTKGEDWNPGKIAQTIPTSNFIDRKAFDASWLKVQSASVPQKAVAGVVNHHALAADLLAGFFVSLKSSAPDTSRFVVISPDHFFSGRGPISTHDRNYGTPDGILESDGAFIASLVSSTPALLESGVMFEHEHGIGALAPFIKHEFPAAKIVSIAFQGSMDRGMARDFGARLAEMIDGRTVIIISSDMSHYLPEKTALENDQTTIKGLASLDAAFFSTIKDDYVDNGVGLLALSSLMEELQLEPNFHLVGHGISSDYVSDDRNTTSYVNGIWTR